MPKGVYKKKSGGGKYSSGTTHLCGGREIMIIERLPYVKGKQPRAIIMFVETGYTVNAQLSNIPTGKIKDKREPSVYGVGYLDCDIYIPARGSGEIRRAYDLWCNMLRRAYYDKNGSSVDVRWHSFKNFLNSLSEIHGYEEWLHHDYHLDKDILIRGNKIYSRDTCLFVSAFDNVQDSALRRWGKK